MAFINIHYGENESLLINLNCCVGNLLHWLKREAKTDISANIDLVDGLGTLQNLSGVNQQEYAVEILKNRQEYILVKIERDANANYIIPLLKNLEVSNPKLIDRLQEQATAQALQNTLTANDGIQNSSSSINSVLAVVSMKKKMIAPQHDNRISRCQSPATSTSSVKSSTRSKKRVKMTY